MEQQHQQSQTYNSRVLPEIRLDFQLERTNPSQVKIDIRQVISTHILMKLMDFRDKEQIL